MNALIRWDEYPLRDVIKILHGDLKVDDEINFIDSHVKAMD